MRLLDAMASVGLVPRGDIVPGRWLRFPGIGKGRANRAGWCRVISPTLAIFGDFSTGLSEVWRDESHRDSDESRRLLAQARERERQFSREQLKRAKGAEREAQKLLDGAKANTHPYLIAKGFKHTLGLVNGSELLVPVRAVEDYSRLISLQRIAPDGTKRFLAGGRVRGGIHRLGASRPDRAALCEGFATGLSVHAAVKLLPGRWAVIVCFSASNLEAVAPNFPGSLICADNDESGVGEQAARRTGLPWVMPPVVGEDINDMHRRLGLIHVVEMLRLSIMGRADAKTPEELCPRALHD